MDFLKNAKDFVKNPLGIIALFISLIYGFASMLLGSAAGKLSESERWPIIGFIIIFPGIVLHTFYRLVTMHHGKLYAPGDFRNDLSFLKTLSNEESEEELTRDAVEALPVGTPIEPIHQSTPTLSSPVDRSMFSIREEIRETEDKVIKLFESEINMQAKREVKIGDTDANFDAAFPTPNELLAVEVKLIRSQYALVAGPILDRVLYYAIIADKYFNSNFRLIIAIVHELPTEERERMLRAVNKRIAKCPAKIEVRLIHKSQLSAA